jgi:pimeloyl-ACP methyl ester carboxylesterase
VLSQLSYVPVAPALYQNAAGNARRRRQRFERDGPGSAAVAQDLILALQYSSADQRRRQLMQGERQAAAAPIDGMVRARGTGLAVHYRDWGGAGRPIALVHGLASSARIWDLMAPLLAAAGRVVALDQRGHGESEKPETGYDLATMVEDLRGALAALDLEDAVVVGHSWGATVALAYATRPDTPGVVLVDGGLADMQSRPGASWERTERELAPPSLEHLRLDDLVAGMGRGRLGHLDRTFMRDFAGSLMLEQPDGTIRPRLTRERHMAILRAIWDQRPPAALAASVCPILAVVAGSPADAGEHGAMIRRTIEQAGARPGLTVEWMPDTIHDIPLQRPRELSDLIIGWMREQGLSRE